MPGETWDIMRDGGANTYYNDGGQETRGNHTADTVEKWKTNISSFDSGDLIAYENNKDYMYAVCDGTKAYSSEKLEKWVRQVVFVRPHTFVMFDRMISVKPEYKKTWLIHSLYEPSIVGRNIMIKNDKNILYIRTLLPEDPSITKVSGYTYGGLTFEPTVGPTGFDASKWRTEVSPSTSNKEDVFIHVLSTSEPLEPKLTRSGSDYVINVGDATITLKEDVGGKITAPNIEYNLSDHVNKYKYE
jgi:heparin/heparan-sulfate lyase